MPTDEELMRELRERMDRQEAREQELLKELRASREQRPSRLDPRGNLRRGFEAAAKAKEDEQKGGDDD